VIEKWRVEYNTRRPHSSPPDATKLKFTGPSCDVDSLIRRGTKTRSGHSGYIHFSVDIEQCRYLLYICVQNTQIQMRVFLS
jgi:hypothetical protein